MLLLQKIASVYMIPVRSSKTLPEFVGRGNRKIINIEAKTSLQPPLGIKKIDFKYPKSYRPSIKKEKNKASQKH